MITVVRKEFQKIKSPRDAAPGKNVISLTDCLMSAFAMFNLKYPSLLQFDRSHRLDPQVQHNLGTLYGIEQIPSDTYMRERLDEGAPSTLRKVYKRLFAFLQRGKSLESYRYLNGRYLLAGDGTGFFASNVIHCDQCCIKHDHKLSVVLTTKQSITDLSLKARSYILANPLRTYFALWYIDDHKKITLIPIKDIDSLPTLLHDKKMYKELSKEVKAEIELAIKSYHYARFPDEKVSYYHNMYCAAIVHPDKKVVIPFVPELIMKEDGDTKNDCERNASKRLYRDLKREHPHLKVIVVEDSLASNYPHLNELKNLDMQFITGAKEGDHKALFKWLNEHECITYEHKTEDGVTHSYRYINGAPLNTSHYDFKVNFMEYWETNKKGGKQHFSWVTDITITNNNAYDIMRGGRANWKIENPIFNTLKNLNYHFGHNFGHGYKNLSTMLALLMMLAFFVDQVQELCCNMFQKALKMRQSKIGLWDKMKRLFSEYFVDNWNDLFNAIIHGQEKIKLNPINTS
ncbi:hypothetical protein TUM19329_19650 [Legionella antarctica]|uniref:Transposase n=1 Tax=Legionella antarctica TaxID=2708020 RepID=A0A6F8T4J4_9GAMM|nr:hypothetical protein TUM19329_07930 [Legionella antarctica]BCA95604.1 hypothetical protein TUM19329_19650 [Legionella antarctica]